MTRDEVFQKIQAALIEGHVEYRREFSEETCPDSTQEYKEEDKKRFEKDFQELRDATTIGDLFAWMGRNAFDVSQAVALSLCCIIEGAVKEDEFWNVPLRWDT